MKHKWLVIVLGLALLTISATPQQDVIRLESRVNQLEQRLYSIESSIRTVEQQSRVAGANQRGVDQEDVARLRAEIQTLQLRLADDECALARVDERTLSSAMRAARQKSTGRTDPCRANFDAPLRLSDRE
jgi:predicted  nucleic acid-binding Zn-ribbon protein